MDKIDVGGQRKLKTLLRSALAQALLQGAPAAQIDAILTAELHAYRSEFDDCAEWMSKVDSLPVALADHIERTLGDLGVSLA